ncbi:hypothetical protein [Ruicaihuangia caeni]|uniref:ABC transporter permease n=1 Tax=Ruicaihuangia caeni TaxID=3042517 RepID=A0AAW6T5I4_9MICO|nr:hypothetical protein [Klugiella sp. YN-L-19]MDI2097633.1 hypothetical protein [Klugiella sp. YN-L-19]
MSAPAARASAHQPPHAPVAARDADSAGVVRDGIRAHAVPAPASGSAANAGVRAWRVVRLHFVNFSTIVIVPWIVLFAIALLSVAVWAVVLSASPVIATAAPLALWSGAVFYLFVYMSVVAVQAMSATFPFALGIGSTRRDYAVGTALAFTLLSAGYGLALTALSVAEEATGGWWLGGRMFATPGLTDGPLLERLVVFFTGLMLFFFVGAVFAAAWLRWRVYGLVALGGALAALFVVLLFGITATGSWPSVIDALVRLGAFGGGLWSLAPTALAAVAAFLLLRRVTPRG